MACSGIFRHTPGKKCCNCPDPDACTFDISFMGYTIRDDGYVRNNSSSGTLVDPVLSDLKTAVYSGTDPFTGAACCTQATNTITRNETNYTVSDSIRVSRGGMTPLFSCLSETTYPPHSAASNTGISVYKEGSQCYMDLLVTLVTSFAVQRAQLVRYIRNIADCDEPGVNTTITRCNGTQTGINACTGNFSLGGAWVYGALRIPVSTSLAGTYELTFLPSAAVHGCPVTITPYAAHADTSVLPSHTWTPPYSIAACWASTGLQYPGFTWTFGLAGVIEDLRSERMYVSLGGC